MASPIRDNNKRIYFIPAWELPHKKHMLIKHMAHLDEFIWDLPSEYNHVKEIYENISQNTIFDIAGAITWDQAYDALGPDELVDFYYTIVGDLLKDNDLVENHLEKGFRQDQEKDSMYGYPFPNDDDDLFEGKESSDSGYHGYDDDSDTIYLTNGETSLEFYKDGGKWHEGQVDGKKPYGWGSKTYMGYLSAEDLINYIESDYGGDWNIEGETIEESKMSDEHIDVMQKKLDKFMNKLTAFTRRTFNVDDITVASTPNLNWQVYSKGKPVAKVPYSLLDEETIDYFALRDHSDIVAEASSSAKKKGNNERKLIKESNLIEPSRFRNISNIDDKVDMYFFYDIGTLDNVTSGDISRATQIEPMIGKMGTEYWLFTFPFNGHKIDIAIYNPDGKFYVSTDENGFEDADDIWLSGSRSYGHQGIMNKLENYIKNHNPAVNENVMVKPMAIDTSKFEFAHGKKPRGGYGSWFFGRMLTHRVTGDVAEIGSPDVFKYNGSYSDAKKAAMRHAKAKGWEDIELLP